MKQKIQPFILALIVCLISFSSFAQEQYQSSLPRWVSDKGYWVLESNIHHPLDHIILFYNNDNTLIYKETVSGVRINPAKKKTRIKLKRALDAALIAWEKNKVPGENKEYVSSVLR